MPEALRPKVKAIAFRLLRPVYAGTAVSCPICRKGFRQLINVGSAAAPRYQCPGCGCYDRHRLLALYLDRRAPGGLPGGTRLLHFAPEPTITRLFEAAPIHYVSGDLGSRAADVQLDITALPLRAAAFDLVLCSHVLEHVPADGAAMGELLRVVAADGEALLQVPIKAPDRTIEIDEVESEAERRKMAGDHGHVRAYGRDFADKVRAAGFAVEVVTPASLGPDVARRFAIDPTEELFVCRRPSGGPGTPSAGS